MYDGTQLAYNSYESVLFTIHEMNEKIFRCSECHDVCAVGCWVKLRMFGHQWGASPLAAAVTTWPREALPLAELRTNDARPALPLAELRTLPLAVLPTLPLAKRKNRRCSRPKMETRTSGRGKLCTRRTRWILRSIAPSTWCGICRATHSPGCRLTGTCLALLKPVLRYVSRSTDQYLWLPDSDPANLVVSDLQDGHQKKLFFRVFLLITVLFKGTFSSFFKDKKP